MIKPVVVPQYIKPVFDICRSSQLLMISLFINLEFINTVFGKTKLLIFYGWGELKNYGLLPFKSMGKVALQYKKYMPKTTITNIM